MVCVWVQELKELEMCGVCWVQELKELDTCVSVCVCVLGAGVEGVRDVWCVCGCRS